MSEQNTQTENVNNLPAVIGEATLTRAQSAGFALPENREHLEMMQDLMQAEADIESIGLPMVSSKDIVGVPVTILDASFKSIKEANGDDKICVNFKLQREDTGEIITCLKSSNSFNDLYATFFNKWRGVAERTLPNYQFLESDKFKKAGNPAIVLQKIQAPKTVAAKK